MSSGGGGTPVAESPECEPPPTVDTSESCGEETVQLFRRVPTIYFVLDISGSMAELVIDGNDSKLDAAKKALTTVASEIGARAKYGLAVFPSQGNEDDTDDVPPGCFPGEEVFSVQSGDPIECVNLPPGGPVLSQFKSVVGRLEALGGTPLSPTLGALTPTLTGQEGTTAVVLITDGSPNCNNEATCEAAECLLNMTGSTIIDDEQNVLACDEELNCCDPEQVGGLVPHPRSRCVDVDESEAKLSALHNAGVPTYVVGVLGSEDFDEAMNRLALAGGRPLTGDRSYYDVSSLDELTGTVRAIGLDVTQTCSIELLERPPFANELNVYFDAVVVPQDEDDGWTLEEDVVTLHGGACDRLVNGEVEEVQLLSGCQTIVR